MLDVKFIGTTFNAVFVHTFTFLYNSTALV